MAVGAALKSVFGKKGGKKSKKPAKRKAAPKKAEVSEAERLEEEALEAERAKQKQGFNYFSPSRLDVAEALWDEGILTPGGYDYALYLVKVLGLTDANSLLQIGGELGGVARAWTRAYGVWVDALERDETFAKNAAGRSAREGLGKKANIKLYDPETFNLKERKYDAVASIETFYTIKDKQHLFSEIHKSLRPNGHLVFSDIVKGMDGDLPVDVEKWIDDEPYPVFLTTPNEMVDIMKASGFEIRISENITADHRKMIIEGWVKYLGKLNKQILMEKCDDVLAECAFWARRVKALDSGGIRYQRFHAIKLPDKPKF